MDYLMLNCKGDEVTYDFCDGGICSRAKEPVSKAKFIMIAKDMLSKVDEFLGNYEGVNSGLVKQGWLKAIALVADSQKDFNTMEVGFFSGKNQSVKNYVLDTINYKYDKLSDESKEALIDFVATLN